MTESTLERAWLDLTEALSPLEAQAQVAYLARLALLAAERIDDSAVFSGLCAEASA